MAPGSGQLRGLGSATPYIRIYAEVCIVDLDDTGGHGKQLGKLRGELASGSGNDLEALVVGSDGDGLDEAVVLDALGKLVQLGLIEGAAWVGGGLVNGVDGEKSIAMFLALNERAPSILLSSSLYLLNGSFRREGKEGVGRLV